jgi:Domain of unknown function (DUF4145)
MFKEKQQTTEFLKCRHCGNYAPMEIATTYYLSTKPEAYDDYDEYYNPYTPEMEQGYNYTLFLCLACKNVTLQQYFDYDSSDPEDITVETLYPQQGIKLSYLPSLVQKAYEAALKARGIDANAYAILLGRMLEIVCEDRKVKGKDLNDKLKVLATKGEIPTNLVDIAHSLRKLRNIGAHETLDGLSDDEMPILDELSKAILEYVYRTHLTSSGFCFKVLEAVKSSNHAIFQQPHRCRMGNL